jgi:hypothetical protein
MGITQISSFFSIAPALKRKASMCPCVVCSMAKPDDELAPSHLEHATHALAGVYHLCPCMYVSVQDTQAREYEQTKADDA